MTSKGAKKRDAYKTSEHIVMDTNNKDSVVNSNTQQKAMYEEKETFQKTSDAKTPTFITNNRTPSPKDRSPIPPTSLFHPLQHTHRTSMHTPKAIKKYLSINIQW